MSWLDATMVGFDTETTGVSTERDRIVSAAIITRTGDEVSARDWLIDPGIEIPARATEVHGITTERARSEGVQPADALEEIASILAQALVARVPVVGFNVQYDLSILEAELARHSLPSLASRVPAGVRPIVDPYVLDRHLDRYRKGKRKLIDLCTLYAVPVVADDLHAADADVLATLDLVHALAAAYPTIREVDLDALHDQQQAAHRDWAVGFAAWLKSRGRTDDLPRPEWPIAPPATAAGDAPGSGAPASAAAPANGAQTGSDSLF
ncbi:exonuclease domain-containing protein [Demequina sp. SO4-18]|uniref:exonuclease domain-containing protein n=1 Tax=Demequina sp. SO4-18 TaxID=3401026 RepID=UPI003B5AC876